MDDKTRIILHIDMNSYFASVEQQANPHLRGRPVGVCEHLGGIIIAPSVEAKRFGIKVGTPVWEAKRLYPKIILLPVDPAKYRHTTAGFLRILLDYTDSVEKASIDEAFMDVTGFCKNYDEALFLGLEIKQRLRREVGEWVSCSIGVGPNKLVAKIAADLGDGDIDRIAAVRPEDIPRLYQRLKLTDIPGIGRRLALALQKIDVMSLRQLADYPVANLLNQFGISGYFLHQLANFEDTTDIVTQEFEEIKSIGHSYTMPCATEKLVEVKKLLFKLAEKVGRRLRQQGAWGRVVHYFHSDKHYHAFHKQRKLNYRINDGRDIYLAALQILQADLPLRLPVKIVGVTVSDLSFSDLEEPLFVYYRRPVWLTQAMDLINDKYGEFTIRRGRLTEVPTEWAKDTVGFGRMKEFSV